jgi:hypothetical protein
MQVQVGCGCDFESLGVDWHRVRAGCGATTKVEYTDEHLDTRRFTKASYAVSQWLLPSEGAEID